MTWYTFLCFPFREFLEGLELQLHSFPKICMVPAKHSLPLPTGIRFGVVRRPSPRGSAQRLPSAVSGSAASTFSQQSSSVIFPPAAAELRRTPAPTYTNQPGTERTSDPR